MKTFEISVKDKIAALTNGSVYVCGNSDFVVDFSFDAEWDAYDTKTARFAYKGTYQDQVFQGTRCPVPIIHDTQIIMVGVFSGNLHTTTAACISARKSILSGSGVPADPAPDVYAQIMELIQGLGEPDPETIAAAVADYIRQNPIEESDPTVPAWAKAAEKPAYTAAEVGAISQEDLQAATDAALSQAKESGQFDGEKGDPGADGKSAYQYAVEGGYTGTEAEFAEKLAMEIPVVDGTLTQSGKAADAAVVGERLSTLSEEIENIHGAVITATGDSIVSATTGESTIGGYVKLIADQYDMIYENVAVGGGTIASGITNQNGNATFSICDSISSMRSDADIIILSGGVNDQAMINNDLEVLGELTADFASHLNKTTLYGGLEYLLRQAVYKWSNKTVLFVIPHRMTKALDYKTAVHASCEKYGVPVVDLTESSPDFYYLKEFQTQYTANADGWHPNESGYLKFYVPRILSAIQQHFRGKGDTITLTDNNLPALIGGNADDSDSDAEIYTPNIAGFIRENGTISTSTNYLRTDYLSLSGRKTVEYKSFILANSGMASWAIFDANKTWIASSGDVDGDDYYHASESGGSLPYGYKHGTLSVEDLLAEHTTAAYIVLSTCVNEAYKFINDANGVNIGWSSEDAYITLA